MVGLLTFFDVGTWIDQFTVQLRDRVHMFDPHCVVADGDTSDVLSRRVLIVGAASRDGGLLDTLAGDESSEMWNVLWSLTVHWDTRNFSEARQHAQRIIEELFAAAQDSGFDQVLETIPTVEEYQPYTPADGTGALVGYGGTVGLTVVV